jgi:hypothetical protein
MTTKIVNKRTNEYDVYIGRGSIWGNPFKIGIDGSRDEVILKYEKYLQNNPDLLKKLPSLKGKTLGCFCKPKACHGDVLARLCDDSYEKCPESEEPTKIEDQEGYCLDCDEFTELYEDGRCVNCIERGAICG